MDMYKISPEVFRKLTLKRRCMDLLQRNLHLIPSDEGVVRQLPPDVFAFVLGKLAVPQLRRFKAEKAPGYDLQIDELWRQHFHQEFTTAGDDQAPEQGSSWERMYREEEQRRNRQLSSAPSFPPGRTSRVVTLVSTSSEVNNPKKPSATPRALEKLSPSKQPVKRLSTQQHLDKMMSKRHRR